MKMSRSWTKICLVTALVGLVTLMPLPSAAQKPAPAAPSPVVVRRFVIVQPFPGWYDPWWWGWGPNSAYVPYAPAAYTGSVKIVTERKDASVYVDGGYAGRAGKLKKFELQAGTHTIEFRDSDGRRLYVERVHVIAGKTVKIYLG